MWEINLLYPQKLQKSQCFCNVEIQPILKLKPFSLSWLLIGICIVLICWWLTKRVILSGDIELNPGPGTDLNRKSDLLVITQNCRGLNEPKKLRDLLNKLYKKVKGNDSYIIMLQETMLTSSTILKYMWRGQFVFTPGTGNARGCISLCPNDCIITSTRIIGERGHIFKVKFHQLFDSITAVNLYAPTTRSEEKTRFFTDLESKIDELKEIDEDLIVAGDFNTPLNGNEVFKRSFDKTAEKQAKALKQVIDRLNLMDCWHDNKVSHTWTNRGASSRLDRICYSLENLIITDTAVDWALCKSDHAAVISKFEKKNNKAKVTRTFTPYLNSTLLSNSNCLNSIS